jgi:hypothetical protein
VCCSTPLGMRCQVRNLSHRCRRGRRRWPRRVVVVAGPNGRRALAWQGGYVSVVGAGIVAEREDVLVEGDVPRRDDAASGDVVAPVSSVVRRVPDEDARRRPRGKLVRRCRNQVGEASAAEHPELGVRRRYTEEESVGRRSSSSATWSPVDQVHRRGKGLRPERQWSCTMY